VTWLTTDMISSANVGQKDLIRSLPNEHLQKDAANQLSNALHLPTRMLIPTNKLPPAVTSASAPTTNRLRVDAWNP